MTMKIVVSGGKGGIGKTTLSAIVGDWLLKEGLAVRFRDADVNQSLQNYIDKCIDAGRKMNSDNPEIEIVDTAGSSGSTLRHVNEANIILVPFKPNILDIEVIMGWFVSLHPRIQERVYFIPNEFGNIKEQRSCLETVESIVHETGKGKIISGLSTRKAVYPKLLEGSTTNIFNQPLNERTKNELEKLMREIDIIRGEVCDEAA